MKKVKLGDVCEILNGYAFKSNLYEEAGIRVIRITNVQKGYIDDSEPKFYNLKMKDELTKYMLCEKDLLISLTGNVGRVGILEKEMLPAALNQRVGCIRISDDSQLNKDYLFNALNNEIFENECIKNSKGIAQKNLSTEWLKEYEINLPSLDEQISIANKLDKVQRIINWKNKQIEELDKMIKSQFAEIFGDLSNTNYPIYKLEELTNLITDGVHKKPNYTEFGVPFISVVNITTGELNFEDCKYISKEDANKYAQRCKPELNDILYTKVGATYGRSAIVDTEKEFTLYVSVCLIKPKKEKINPVFLNYTMKQPYIKSQADKSIKGIGVPDLHLIEIKKFDIILPPVELQNQFAEFVKQIDKKKFEIQKSLEEIQKLKESLMNKYFGG